MELTKVSTSVAFQNSKTCDFETFQRQIGLSSEFAGWLTSSEYVQGPQDKISQDVHSNAAA